MHVLTWLTVILLTFIVSPSYAQEDITKSETYKTLEDTEAKRKSFFPLMAVVTSEYKKAPKTLLLSTNGYSKNSTTGLMHVTGFYMVPTPSSLAARLKTSLNKKR